MGDSAWAIAAVRSGNNPENALGKRLFAEKRHSNGEYNSNREFAPRATFAGALQKNNIPGPKMLVTGARDRQNP